MCCSNFLHIRTLLQIITLMNNVYVENNNTMYIYVHHLFLSLIRKILLCINIMYTIALQCYDCPQTFYPEECKKTKECNVGQV